MKSSQIASNSGWTGNLNGKEVAVFNDGANLIVLENVCTHRHCQTAWNAAAGTWDCPCHGSRYRADGTVLQGPARQDLAKLSFQVDEAGEIRLD